MGDNYECIVWSNQSEKLCDFVQKFPLPQIVEVVDGYDGGRYENTISGSEILKIHGTTTEVRVKCENHLGKVLYFPVSSQNIELKHPHHKNEYSTVSELSQVKPTPDWLIVARDYTDNDIQLNANQILEVISVNKALLSRKSTFNVRNFKGETFHLPLECHAGFFPSFGNTTYQLCDVIPSDTNKKQFPFYFEFLERTRETYGILKAVSVETFNLVMASCGDEVSETGFMLSRDLQITVKVAAGAIEHDPVYESVKTIFRRYENFEKNFKTEGMYYSSASEVLSVQLPTQTKLNKDTNESSKINKFLPRVIQKKTTQRSESVNFPLEPPKGINNYEQLNITEIDSYEQLGETKPKLPGRNISTSREQLIDKRPKVPERSTSSDDNKEFDGNACLTDVGKTPPDPRMHSKPGATKPSEQIIQIDIGNQQYKNVPTSPVDSPRSPKSPFSQSPTKSPDSPVPQSPTKSPDSPVPQSRTKSPSSPSEDHYGNIESIKQRPFIAPRPSIPKQPLRKHNEASSKAKINSDYEIPNPAPVKKNVEAIPSNNSLSAEESLDEIQILDSEQFSNVLKTLNMQNHIDMFTENQVDGSLFIELDEDELKELGLNKFEIKKLLKYKKGWRPK